MAQREEGKDLVIAVTATGDSWCGVQEQSHLQCPVTTSWCAGTDLD
jgi:hypothetical protein